jgi:shikimate dehydrogenase
MTPTAKAKIAGIMGWPVSHSRSPRLHGFWLAEHGIDGAYVPMAVRPAALVQALRALPALGFRGCNLTIPHKEAALAALDRIDPLARRIGAVNTVVVAEDGGLHGSNTDVYGFLSNLRQVQPGWRAAAGPAVVLGAGGAARAILAALLEAGVPAVRLINRTRRRAEALVTDMGGPITVLDWTRRAVALDGAALLVNATSLGMSGNAPLELDLAALPTAAVVYDIVYVPLETPLLKTARARGNPVVDGLGMLLHQARPGFAAWFGVEPAVTPALRAAIEATLVPS